MSRGEIDPRPARIARELGSRATLIVSGVKGGVGKTVIAAALAAYLAGRGVQTLAVDADVSDPNLHVALGVDPETQQPGEELGIKPLQVAPRLGYVGAAPYTRNRPAPMRGPQAVDAVRELLAATDYRGYEAVVIDTPPGLGDVILDLTRLIPGSTIILVTTPHKLALDSLRRALGALRVEGREADMVIINMFRGEELPSWLKELPHELAPYDPHLETALGSPEALRRTELGRALKGIVGRLVRP